MKKRKDIKKLLLASAVLLTFGIGQQLEPLQPVYAARQVKKSRKAKKGKKAKVSINKKKLSLLQGKTARLYLKNSKKKTTWRSSNKKVATVSSKGKVKAVKAGTAKITAKNGKKCYACMVKVTAAKGTLTFASNDGSGRRQKKIFTLGKKVTLPKTGFDRKGYKFLNYTVATNGKGKKYRLGKAYTFKKSTTLWAQYRKLENVDVKTQSTSGLVKAEVKFIAHRGYSTKYPENTTLAFEKAGEEAGVWGIETDVDNTSDNKLVIMHDNTLARTTNISADDPNYRKNINDIPFDQVENYKIKGVLDGVDKDKVYEDLRVPTLRQYLEICKKYGKEAFLELKCINNMEALKEVVKEINEAGMQKQTTLISFNIGELEEVRNVIPGGKEIAMMGIYSRHLTDNDYIFLSHLKAGADCDCNKTTLDDILAARKYGVDYGIWTVCKNDNAVADMIKNGADKVTLNDAGLIESMGAIVNN
ncbi:glycerophosphodiester phosphodiesterase [Lactobacillus delbrueckii subsp. bulgaricus]|nr:glycerophosphodiester phosphodiesterase [Lactobacillus delbrueckii subsp. bulgaricus]MBT8814702.1 glycerophosphodiester phosphodiesterase [Lactobacillus delbrueckii subsp. bulgaricus]